MVLECLVESVGEANSRPFVARSCLRWMSASVISSSQTQPLKRRFLVEVDGGAEGVAGGVTGAMLALQDCALQSGRG